LDRLENLDLGFKNLKLLVFLNDNSILFVFLVLQGKKLIFQSGVRLLKKIEFTFCCLELILQIFYGCGLIFKLMPEVFNLSCEFISLLYYVLHENKIFLIM